MTSHILQDFVAVVLATGAIIDVWHNGSIFAMWRAYVQAKNDAARHGSITGLWTELLICPFCKSYHIPIYLYAILLSADWIGSIVAVIARLIVYGLAATRLSNIIDGLLPARMRYDRPFEFGTQGDSGKD
jgi:hypothetical protein